LGIKDFKFADVMETVSAVMYCVSYFHMRQDTNLMYVR